MLAIVHRGSALLAGKLTLDISGISVVGIKPIEVHLGRRATGCWLWVGNLGRKVEVGGPSHLSKPAH